MTFARMLNELDSLLESVEKSHVESKRRLITFKLQIRKAPRPEKKWSLNSSLEPNIRKQIKPEGEKDLTVI